MIIKRYFVAALPVASGSSPLAASGGSRRSGSTCGWGRRGWGRRYGCAPESAYALLTPQDCVRLEDGAS